MGNSSFDLYKLDLDYLQKTIDKFDGQRFAIRNWSVTATGALLAVAVSQKNVAIPALAVLLVATFAYLEIIYMDLQVRIQDRSTEVCALLVQAAKGENQTVDVDPKIGIREALGTHPFHWKRAPSLIRSRPELYVFYLALAALALVSMTLIWIFR